MIASTPGVAPYFDLSFQHASGRVLRAMRRFGDRERFLRPARPDQGASPEAGVRSNFIVGFPGETADDLRELELFLSDAGLDAIGIFGYSDEDGTEAASLPGQLDEAEIARRVEEFAGLADELMAQRADEQARRDPGRADRGRGRRRPARGFPGPGRPSGARGRRGDHGQDPGPDSPPGDMVRAVVTGSEGVDLIADVPPR